MSQIAEQVTTLDKLSWAIFSDAVKVARAAGMLRARGFDRSTLDSDSTAKHALRILVHETAPEKGKILAREREIKDEVQRQDAVAWKRPRPVAADNTSPTSYRIAHTADRSYFKDNLILDYGRRLGINGLQAFRRYGKVMLYFSGGFGGNYRTLHIRPNMGEGVYRVKFFRSGAYDCAEALIASLPYAALEHPNAMSILAKAVLDGARVAADLQRMQTIIDYSDSNSVHYPWSVQIVSAQPDE